MTMDAFVLVQEHIGNFFLVFARVAGLLFATPVLGNKNVPPVSRTLLALLVTMVILPIVPVSRLAPESPGFIPALISEVILGGFLGFIGTLLFAAAELGGHIAGLQMGFAIANVLSPEGELQTSVFSSLMGLTALLVFVMSDAHHLFITALVRSFDTLPLGTFTVDAARTGSLLRMSTGIFRYGLALAAPVLAITIFITVALGIISRTMPQVDVFFMSFAINIVAGISAFILSLPFLFAGIERLIDVLNGELLNVLGAAG
jgi:flagellar biosynthetic protein FliR